MSAYFICQLPKGIQYLEPNFTGTGGPAPRIGAPDTKTAIAPYDALADARGVIAFRNLPHTPRRKPVAKRAVREVKDEANLVLLGPRPPPLPPVEEWTKRLKVAPKRTQARIRPGCRPGQTSAELDDALPEPETIVDRSVFYAAAKEAMAAARQAHEKPRAARIAERHALIRVLLNFGPMRVRVGGVLLSIANSEMPFVRTTLEPLRIPLSGSLRMRHRLSRPLQTAE